jgi:hypothetical protein
MRVRDFPGEYSVASVQLPPVGSIDNTDVPHISDSLHYGRRRHLPKRDDSNSVLSTPNPPKPARQAPLEATNLNSISR